MFTGLSKEQVEKSRKELCGVAWYQANYSIVALKCFTPGY